MLEILFILSPHKAMLAAFALTASLSLLIVLTKGWHGKFSLDGDEGMQKVHRAPTPRVGGIAIFAGLFLSTLLLSGPLGLEARGILDMVMLAGVPAFLSGFVEDITKAVRPIWRLVATIVSGLIFAIPMGQAFLLADTQWITDAGPAIYVLCVVIVAIGMGGVANAVNITDGYHGLASGSVVIMCLGYAALAAIANDLPLAMAALVFAAAMAGFLVVNFPFGKIFLGDAGAYFSGVVLAAFGFMVTARNPEISPFVSLLVLFYPIYETLFSIYRKTRREGSSPMLPDRVHLHALMSRALARPMAGYLHIPAARNAISGVLMWPFTALCSIMAVATWGSGRAAVLCCVIVALLYGRVYLVASLQAAPFSRRRQSARRTPRNRQPG